MPGWGWGESSRELPLTVNGFWHNRLENPHGQTVLLPGHQAQSIVVNSTKSNSQLVTQGVPQGSLIGLKLLNASIYNLKTEHTLSESVNDTKQWAQPTPCAGLQSKGSPQLAGEMAHEKPCEPQKRKRKSPALENLT